MSWSRRAGYGCRVRGQLDVCLRMRMADSIFLISSSGFRSDFVTSCRSSSACFSAVSRVDMSLGGSENLSSRVSVPLAHFVHLQSKKNRSDSSLRRTSFGVVVSM